MYLMNPLCEASIVHLKLKRIRLNNRDIMQYWLVKEGRLSKSKVARFSKQI